MPSALWGDTCLFLGCLFMNFLLKLDDAVEEDEDEDEDTDAVSTQLTSAVWLLLSRFLVTFTVIFLFNFGFLLGCSLLMDLCELRFYI